MNDEKVNRFIFLNNIGICFLECLSKFCQAIVK
ncbi:hypothetical protein Spaf_2078 [Streptococcus parasanguinis FW213]|uniref:Uncharacterized protein n=1 Tax=Streptococcus parasanguinis FW213 TaxID=1114965 RepID=I1ZPN6_STRPA|nr:hypothetical protein Spaf_2078 [Streptococcus parasanguinis FW213]